MKEYVYQETDYIKEVDLAEFHRIMILYGIMPEDIDDMDEYNDVLLFLFSIAEKAPDFLQAYEYAIIMVHQLKETPETIARLKELEHDFMLACERVAIKDTALLWICTEQQATKLILRYTPLRSILQ